MFGAVGAILAAIQQKTVIKSIQSGTTAAAGNVTINAVNTAKTVVLSVSKGSAGYVAARGSISGTVSPVRYQHNTSADPYKAGSNQNGSISASISGGTTDLTTKAYSAELVNSTTISCDGPVEWQVIEFV